TWNRAEPPRRDRGPARANQPGTSPPAPEDRGVLLQETRPVVLVVEAQRRDPDVHERGREGRISLLTVREVVRWAIDVHGHSLVGVVEVGHRHPPGYVQAVLRMVRQAQPLGLEQVEEPSLELARAGLPQPLQV